MWNHEVCPTPTSGTAPLSCNHRLDRLYTIVSNYYQFQLTFTITITTISIHNKTSDHKLLVCHTAMWLIDDDLVPRRRWPCPRAPAAHVVNSVPPSISVLRELRGWLVRWLDSSPHSLRECCLAVFGLTFASIILICCTVNKLVISDTHASLAFHSVCAHTLKMAICVYAATFGVLMQELTKIPRQLSLAKHWGRQP